MSRSGAGPGQVRVRKVTVRLGPEQDSKLKDLDLGFNPIRAVGKYIYHFFFLKFLDLEDKRNPKYFLT